MLTLPDALIISRRHINAMLDELLAASQQGDVGVPLAADARAVEEEPAQAFTPGDWREAERQTGISYRWMDGNIDDYTEFAVYEDGDSGVAMGIGKIAPKEIRGKQRSYQVVFSMEGTKLDPMAVFNEADDFDSTRELLALVRGKGES